MTMEVAAFRDLQDTILARRSDAVVNSAFANNELTLTVTASTLVDFVGFLKTDGACRFTTLIDVTAIDWPERDRRFDLVYHFLSMHLNQRIRVRAEVREDEIVPSIVEAFPVANWYEREVFDMYGILFSGHPDLRRILTDYGFRGHPMRKDFPTTGYVEVRYDEEQKRVVYEPVKLTQEYRQFDFMSPWEGADYILPGDEKGKGG
ncbi:MAG: NADH-quinone oxidoreductase subunit C [Pseudomonadota bacterium]